MKIYLATLHLACLMAWAGVAAQPVFKCTGGNDVVFSDKGCAKDYRGGPISVNSDEVSPQGKAEHDAIVSRDRALSGQVEGARVQREQGMRATQNTHLQADRALAKKYEHSLQQKNDATTSDPSVRQPKQFYYLR